MTIAGLKYFIKNPSKIYALLASRGLLNWMPDASYLKMVYKENFGKYPNLKQPQTFNEKLQWLKLHDRNPLYTQLVDKYKVRQYIADKIGEEYLIPLVGGPWDSFDDINFDTLPEQFVLKCNHDSGGVLICQDKKLLDLRAAKKKLNDRLKHNYYSLDREWPYKNVEKKMIAEKLMIDESGYELKDYKVFCFNGEPKVIQVDFDRFKAHKRNLYSGTWEFLDLQYKYPPDRNAGIQKPQSLELMLKLARKLSEGIPFVRVDFYSIEKKLYFGELSFYPESGTGRFEPEKWDDIFGEWIDLDVRHG